MRCPRECKCLYVFDPDSGPVWCVACQRGDMHSIPMHSIDIDIVQLLITPPEGQENHLTIGPIFTHPYPYTNLKEIRIIHSNVPSIGKNSFWGLHKLKKLNLKYNNLTSIGMDNFRGLLNLTDLNLSHNRIMIMPSETFWHCTALKRLNLSYNRIPALMPRVFRMLGHLTTLDLSGNPLTDLNPEVFGDITQLKFFRCRDCLLSRVNPQIYHLAPSLEEIDLGYNQIKYILIDDFPNLKNLTQLQLDGNQIPVIVDDVFGRNRNLKKLNLSNNRLAMLTAMSFTNLTKLYNLDISHNQIDRFHLQTFAPVVDSLKIIDFSGNIMPLNEIALILQMIPDLEKVGLGNFSLTDMPPNFFMYNKYLRSLDLSWNNLTKIPLKLLSKTKKLQTLDISHNHLTALEEQDLQRLEKIPKVILSENRWHCDQCSAGKMVVFMGTTVLNSSLRNLPCYTPLRLRGTLLSNMTYDTLEKCSKPLESHISVIAGVVLTLVAALAALMGVLCCTRRSYQRYYTNEGKRLERNHEHPEEQQTELDSLATIDAPFHAPCEHS